jgi:hypothetical protein
MSFNTELSQGRLKVNAKIFGQAFDVPFVKPHVIVGIAAAAASALFALHW